MISDTLAIVTHKLHKTHTLKLMHSIAARNSRSVISALLLCVSKSCRFKKFSVFFFAGARAGVASTAAVDVDVLSIFPSFLSISTRHKRIYSNIDEKRRYIYYTD